MGHPAWCYGCERETAPVRNFGFANPGEPWGRVIPPDSGLVPPHRRSSRALLGMDGRGRPSPHDPSSRNFLPVSRIKTLTTFHSGLSMGLLAIISALITKHLFDSQVR